MIKILSLVLILWSSVAFAQTTQIVRGDSKAGANGGVDVKSTIERITDKNIYDIDGHVLDSVTAERMLKTYDYRAQWAIPQGQTELKRVIKKINPAEEEQMVNFLKLHSKPKSSKLWEGVVLDLSPLEKRTDLDKLKNKAIVLVFWTNDKSTGRYAEINDIISKYIGDGKFDVFAITNLPYDVAMAASKRNPINNAHQIIDAPGVTTFYDTGNQPVIVVTNAKHEITYAMTNYAAITPRMLNNLLKSL